MALIGVNGKMSSGKDELCSRLQYNLYKRKCKLNGSLAWVDWCHHVEMEARCHGSTLYRKAFADKLKLAAAAVMGIDLTKYGDRDLKENYYVNLFTFELKHKDDLFESVKDYNIISTAKEIEATIRSGAVSDKMWATYRTFMLQFFGTEVCRGGIPYIWCNSLFNTYTKSDSWIITDMRFKNEAMVCRNIKDSYLIKIIRPTTDGKAGNALSETDLDDYTEFDEIIINDGTYEEYMAKIDELFIRLCEKFGW